MTEFDIYVYILGLVKESVKEFLLTVVNECDFVFSAKAVGDGYVKPEIKQVVKVE